MQDKGMLGGTLTLFLMAGLFVLGYWLVGRIISGVKGTRKPPADIPLRPPPPAGAGEGSAPALADAEREVAHAAALGLGLIYTGEDVRRANREMAARQGAMSDEERRRVSDAWAYFQRRYGL